jgi:hypothetical protein
MADLLSVAVPTVVSAAAGLRGAAIGGWTVLRAAQRNAELARADDRWRWNRDRREPAYVTVLTTSDRYVNTQIQLDLTIDQYARWQAVGGPSSKPPPLAEKAQQALEAEDSLLEALGTVEIFGSRAAQAASHAWAGDLPKRYGGGDPAQPVDEREYQRRKAEEVAQYRDPFLQLVRSELEIPD